MDARELLHRTLEQAQIQTLRSREKSLRQSDYQRAEFGFCQGATEQLPTLEWSPLSIDQQALLNGRWPALGFPWQWQTDSNCWHQAPDSGATWPDTFFATINYRPGNPTGDVRVAWEPSRLQQLVSLARLVVEQTDPNLRSRCVAQFSAIFKSWVAQNPPYRGIHYLSAMECALRLIALCHAFDLIRPYFEPDDCLWHSLLGVVDSHARLIIKRLSLHSSAGNHTIAEAAGMVYAGELFPEFESALSWYETGLALLTREADRQILADGGGLEQAFWYHLFVVDLCGLAVRLLQFRNQEVPVKLSQALARGRKFITAVSTSPADLPAIGDRDDGYALSADLRISWSDADANRPDYLGHPDQPDTPAETAAAKLSQFLSSGYSLIEQNEASLPAVKILLDHGPLGMPPSAGHGHADGLSICLWVDQTPLLIDSGTFTYANPGSDHPDWRSYFRSTAAHNTVTLENLDQARQQGNFLWSQIFNLELIQTTANQDYVALLARHDGYQSLATTHWRGVFVHRQGHIRIWDYLQGDGDHLASLHWHLGQQPVRRAGGWQFTVNQHPLEMTIHGGDPQLQMTEDNAPLGWISPRYGAKTPGCLLRSEQSGPLPLQWTTVIGNRSAPITDDPPSTYQSVIKQWQTIISA